MGIQERKAREKEDRENLIIDAAEQVFFSKGFETSTMDDIASAAELSKGCLYNYFKSKNELCIGIVLRSLNLLLSYMEQAAAEKTDSELQRLRNTALALGVFRRDNHKYYCSLQNYRHHRSGCGADSKFLNLSLDGNRKINELIANIIRDGIAEGSVQQHLDPEKAAAALWGDMDGLLPGFDLNSVSADYKYALTLIFSGIESGQ
ncbi:MAG: TetR/AcrR family transcriptional regulator [Victivallaceae bacterium]